MFKMKKGAEETASLTMDADVSVEVLHYTTKIQKLREIFIFFFECYLSSFNSKKD